MNGLLWGNTCDGGPGRRLVSTPVDDPGGTAANNPANNTSQINQLRKDLEGLSELEVLSSSVFSKYTQRVLVSGGMVFSGAIVAGAGVVGTISACATVVGCLVSPITVGVALAGGGLALEGVYYGVTGTFWDPRTGKSCGPNGCN
jgi:hypothetical protein